MKKYPICFILFIHTMLCIGCDSKQKKNDTAQTVRSEQPDSTNVITGRSTLQEEDILSWDYDQAIVELGEPVFRDSFPIMEANGVSVGLHNHLTKHPADSSMLVRELTFEADDEMYQTIEAFDIKDPTQLKDMYLTIWYVEKDGQWKPVDFLKYNKDTQF